METTPAFAGFACPDCGAVAEPTVDDRCPDCDGVLAIDYDHDEGVSIADLDESVTLANPDEEFADGHADQRRFAPFLPFPPESIPSLGEGGTPLLPCPTLADDLGVDRVLVKDEGRNPTGSVADRGLSLAVTAARQRGRSTVTLPTTGHGGQSAAAYAGRAGLDSQSFVPTRSSHLTKAMVNVHGGEMRVVEGRFPDAVAAYEEWVAERSNANGASDAGDADSDDSSDANESWGAADPASPFRREGAKLLVHELHAQLDWSPPDAVVVPTGHGIGLAGAGAALAELRDHDLVESAPRLVAAQPEGCAPIVRAVAGEGFGTWDRPDTIAGSLEIPDPARGREAVRAVDDTDGEAVAVPDDRLLADAVDETAATGVEFGPAGGVGVAAARAIADDFDADDTVVVVNPVSGSKESDVLRSELMSRGE